MDFSKALSPGKTAGLPAGSEAHVWMPGGPAEGDEYISDLLILLDCSR